MLFTFCETYYHPSDCSKLIVCLSQVFVTEIRYAIGQDVLKSHFPAMLVLIMFERMLHISR